MASPTLSTNGVYLISSDGAKLQLKRSVLDAIRRITEDRGTGKVTLHFRNGGLAHVSDERIYSDEKSS